MAPSVGTGFKVDSYALFETGRLAKKAHNSQSKVNMRKLVGRKSGFFTPETKNVPENSGFRGRRVCL
jgi:hypothetical protein